MKWFRRKPKHTGRVQCVDCKMWLADSLKTFPEFDHQPLCFRCAQIRREAAFRTRWKFFGRMDSEGVPHYVWVCERFPIEAAPGCYTTKFHMTRVDRFWLKPCTCARYHPRVWGRMGFCECHGAIPVPWPLPPQPRDERVGAICQDYDVFGRIA